MVVVIGASTSLMHLRAPSLLPPLPSAHEALRKIADRLRATVVTLTLSVVGVVQLEEPLLQ